MRVPLKKLLMRYFCKQTVQSRAAYIH